jgi:hypothetical protein
VANNVIKIACVTPETYRKPVKYFKENNTFYHTYQLKEERYLGYLQTNNTRQSKSINKT